MPTQKGRKWASFQVSQMPSRMEGAAQKPQSLSSLLFSPFLFFSSLLVCLPALPCRVRMEKRKGGWQEEQSKHLHPSQSDAVRVVSYPFVGRRRRKEGGGRLLLHSGIMLKHPFASMEKKSLSSKSLSLSLLYSFLWLRQTDWPWLRH